MEENLKLSQLWLLENPLLAKKKLCELHQLNEDCKPTYENYYELATSIRQMRALLNDAKSCSIRTRPILLYYASVQLAKATIICSQLNSANHHLTQKHGVSIQSKKIVNGKYLEERIRIEKQGTLITWLQAISTLKHIQYSDVSETTPTQLNSLRGLQLSIKDLWTMLPESELYERTGSLTRKVYVDKLEISKERTMFTLPRILLAQWGLTIDQFEEWIRCQDIHHILTNIRYNDNKITLDLGTNLHTILHFTPSSHLFLQYNFRYLNNHDHNTHMIAFNGPQLPWPLSNDLYLQEPIIYYMLLFHLSMLSRYYPLEWLDLIADDTSIDYMSIELLCNHTESVLIRYAIEWFILN
ncbi:MAG: YaaC family protein [Acidibacillus sp.]|nr:YaaC family protein [Acidibacillus sp.]